MSSSKTEQNKCASSRKKTWEGRKPESPMGTTVEIIELFEKDPSFSGILGGIDSSREPTIGVKIVETLISFRGYFKLGSNIPHPPHPPDNVVLFSVS